MKTNSYGPSSPQPKEIGNSLFAVDIHKNIDCFFDEYAPSTCEECGRLITERDQREAVYADGKFLCGEHRAVYMEEHHSDPFLHVGGIIV